MTRAAKQVTHRLTDLKTDEVSLVDRAANKKKYLIVKRDNDMKKTQKQGGGITLSPPVKKTVADALSVALEKLSKLAELIEAAVEGEGDLPSDLVADLESVSTELTKAVTSCRLSLIDPPVETTPPVVASPPPALAEPAPEQVASETEAFKAGLLEAKQLVKFALARLPEVTAPQSDQKLVALLEKQTIRIEAQDKQLAALASDLKKMASARPAPSSLVEEPRTVEEPEDHWPRDMNARSAQASGR